MPITFQILDADYHMGVWQIEETEDFFQKSFHFTKDELSEISSRHATHRLQLFASRAILQKLEISDNGYKFLKDHHGKPHIVNIQGDISFSHSHNHAAAIYSKNLLVGIDIQKSTSKIARIAKKFIAEDEFRFINDHDNPLDYFHILWGAKESLYKAYGRRKVDFKCNLTIDPFVYKSEGDQISGLVDMPDYKGKFEIHYSKLKDYYLVYCLEKHNE